MADDETNNEETPEVPAEETPEAAAEETPQAAAEETPEVVVEGDEVLTHEDVEEELEEDDEPVAPRVKPAIPGADLEVDIVREGEDALRSEYDEDYDPDAPAGDAEAEDFSQP